MNANETYSIVFFHNLTVPLPIKNPIHHRFERLACPCWSSMRVQPQVEQGVGSRKLKTPFKFQIQESAGRGDGTPQIISLDLSEMLPFVLGRSEV